jgi:hypothetical protein
MPKPASPIIVGLEEFESYRGGPRAGQTWNDEVPVLIVDDGQVGIMCRWELSDADRTAVANGADIMLTLFTGGRCPPMYVEVFSKNCSADHIATTRGVFKNVPAHLRMYSPEQLKELRQKSAEPEGAISPDNGRDR